MVFGEVSLAHKGWLISVEVYNTSSSNAIITCTLQRYMRFRELCKMDALLTWFAPLGLSSFPKREKIEVLYLEDGWCRTRWDRSRFFLTAKNCGKLSIVGRVKSSLKEIMMCNTAELELRYDQIPLCLPHALSVPCSMENHGFKPAAFLLVQPVNTLSSCCYCDLFVR